LRAACYVVAEPANVTVDEESKAASNGPSEPSLVEAAQDVLRGALHVAEASLALLRAELKLARSSAMTILWLGFALIFLGAGAWLAATASIAAAIYQLSGNLFVGIGAVALGNLAGAVLVVRSMRRCWRDMSLPRTRALLGKQPVVRDGLPNKPSSPGATP